MLKYNDIYLIDIFSVVLILISLYQEIISILGVFLVLAYSLDIKL